MEINEKGMAGLEIPNEVQDRHVEVPYGMEAWLSAEKGEPAMGKVKKILDKRAFL
jgi:hypothetical protein